MGKYIFANKEEYVGEWKDNKKNGQGTLTWPDGEKYIGEFKDDKPNGKGTLIYTNQDRFVGDFKDGKRQRGKIIPAKEVARSKDDSSIASKSKEDKKAIALKSKEDKNFVAETTFSSSTLAQGSKLKTKPLC